MNRFEYVRAGTVAEAVGAFGAGAASSPAAPTSST